MEVFVIKFSKSSSFENFNGRSSVSKRLHNYFGVIGVAMMLCTLVDSTYMSQLILEKCLFLTCVPI